MSENTSREMPTGLEAGAWRFDFVDPFSDCVVAAAEFAKDDELDELAALRTSAISEDMGFARRISACRCWAVHQKARDNAKSAVGHLALLAGLQGRVVAGVTAFTRHLGARC